MLTASALLLPVLGCTILESQWNQYLVWLSQNRSACWLWPVDCPSAPLQCKNIRRKWNALSYTPIQSIPISMGDTGKNWDGLGFRELCKDPRNTELCINPARIGLRFWLRMTGTTTDLGISSQTLSVKRTCGPCPPHTPAHTVSPGSPWGHSKTADPRDAARGVRHLPGTVKTGMRASLQSAIVPSKVSVWSLKPSARTDCRQVETPMARPRTSFAETGSDSPALKSFPIVAAALRVAGLMVLEAKVLDAEVLGRCVYTWFAAAWLVRWAGKFSLKAVYGREANIQLTGNSSGGHSWSQHANWCDKTAHSRVVFYFGQPNKALLCNNHAV